MKQFTNMCVKTASNTTVETNNETIRVLKKVEIKQPYLELLRAEGLKIKMVTPTSFGTQIDFARTYDSTEIETILKDYKVKIKGKSAFVVD